MPLRIDSHVYQTDYAGLDRTRYVCTALGCGQHRDQHTRFAANELHMVNHPRHYNAHPSGIECIDIIRDMTLDSGTAVKYVYRSGEKGPAKQDFEKARFYLCDAIDHQDIVILARKVSVWADRLDVVILHEPDPIKKDFYRAIRRRDLIGALVVVNELIAAH